MRGNGQAQAAAGGAAGADGEELTQSRKGLADDIIVFFKGESFEPAVCEDSWFLERKNLKR